MRRDILSILLASCMAGLSAAGTVRTAAELAAVNRGETTAATNFDLTVTLVREGARETTDSLFVCDESGATSLRYPFARRTTPLRVGERLRLAGTIGRDDRGSAVIVAQSCTAVGEGPPVAAQPVRIRDIHSGDVDFRLVRLTATVHDAYMDEIDRRNKFLVLVEDGQTAYAAIPASFLSSRDLQSLVGATVTITGICDAFRVGSRRHQGSMLTPTDREDIVVNHPADSDSFAAPDISTLNRVSPYQLHMFGRRTARGRVIAAWGKSSALIRAANGECVGIDVAGGRLPTAGDGIIACGFPETDLHNITLTRASWKPAGDCLVPNEQAIRVRAGDLIQRDGDRDIMHPLYHGKPIRIEGTVRTLPSVGNESRLFIDCDGTVFPVDISARPSAAAPLVIGCRAAFTGICVMDIERLRPNTVLPRIRGFTLVLRPTDSVTVLERPSWWTPRRLLAAIGALLAALVGILVWNAALRRAAARKGRELFRAQVGQVKADLRTEERTRLAVELHDTLAQNLTGVSMEIEAANDLRGNAPQPMLDHLGIAAKALKSCRDELRNCLWDLRSQALEETDMTQAILRTLQPCVADSRLAVRFAVPRTRLSDNTAHALLRVVRELVVNAIRHGNASSVRVAGTIDRDKLLCSVTDDGCGFDPDAAPGILQGHFGLQGIRERIDELGGTFEIASAPDKGTKVTISIPIPHKS